MNRRRFVVTGSTAVLATLLAGCFGDSTNDPESAMESFFEAFEDGDAETMNELIHPDAPAGRLDDEEAADVEALGEDLELTIVDLELVEEGDEEAIVESTVEHSHPDFETEAVRDRNTLRVHDGEWLLYEVEALE